jgi:hypothetical protein
MRSVHKHLAITAAVLLLGGAMWADTPAAIAAARPHSATVTSATASSTKTIGATAATKGSPRTARTVTKTLTTEANPETPVPVVASDTPPIGRHLSADRVLEIANALPKMRSVRARYPGSYGGAYTKGPGRWQVSYFSKRGSEIGQVIIADSNGHVLEQWTGFQIAWSMARGYPGAFGKAVNSLYIWLPLCVLFFVPFFDWRKPLRLLHLDLLVLLSFSISLAFFNHGHIYASTPLVYPPLAYLLVRMLLLARVGRRPARATSPAANGPAVGGSLAGLGRPDGPSALSSTPPPEANAGLQPLRLLVPVSWLAVAVIFLLGFRIALNVTNSNVIDVGYAGVIGAHRMTHGESLYGGYPSDNEHGDTYGPVNYEAYVPFLEVFGWSGKWDGLPTAHAAAIAFDLLSVALLFLLGRRIRGPGLGVVFAYAWVSYPFTLFALESNSNDSLVAALVLAAVLAASTPPARGMFAALAGLTKFAPLGLAPLFCTHGLGELEPARRARAVALFVLGFLASVLVVCLPALAHDSLHTIFERTLAYQSNREAPFSIWGLYGGLEYPQAIIEGVALALAVSLAILPRRPDIIGLAAAAAAVLVAIQLGIDYWFYLYIPWFFGLAVVALFGRFSEPGAADPVAPSESAQSSRLVAA